MRAYASNLKREWNTFFPNVVLGFNDALISLTGALVGFSFALHNLKIVAVAGLVTGLSASMSMAASAYQQARHDRGRNPLKAAAFTGISYLVIALVLILPFVFSTSIAVALGVMGIFTILMIGGISFYSAVLLKRRYLVQLSEMCFFSLGVAVVTFLIGQALGAIIGS